MLRPRRAASLSPSRCARSAFRSCCPRLCPARPNATRPGRRWPLSLPRPGPPSAARSPSWPALQITSAWSACSSSMTASTSAPRTPPLRTRSPHTRPRSRTARTLLRRGAPRQRGTRTRLRPPPRPVATPPPTLEPATYQSYWLTAVKADIVDQPWIADGVFADECIAVKLIDFAAYSGIPAKYSSYVDWDSAMNSFAGAISAGLHGYGQRLWCNRGNTRFPDGSGAGRSLDASVSPPDVVLEEGAFAVMWGVGDVQFYQESDWKRQVDTMAAIRNSSVAMISHTKLFEGQAGTDNWGQPVTFWQTLWYSMGSFLLTKNDQLNNAYFMFNGGSGYDKIWWYDEYDMIHLGGSVGPYAVTPIDTSSGPINVYWREFEKGYVYVNPTPSNVASVTLPQACQATPNPCRQLTHDNLLSPPRDLPAVTAIPLSSHNAAIILKM